MTARNCLLLVALALTATALAAPAAALGTPAFSRTPLDPAFARQVASGGPVTLSPITVQRGAAASPLLRAASLPATYSLRDPDPLNGAPSLLTAIRDQAPYNTCWAFATMASLESRLLMGGETWDLSEDNLVMRAGFFTAGRYSVGGNYLMSSAYLARWAGPLTEAADPYDTPATNPVSPVDKHVQGIVLIAARESAGDNDALKTAVMTYGAVATQMYYPSPATGVYNTATDSFYYSDSADPNHGVAIVGWDDTYSAANFATTPAGDGAFLVRNSWGAGWGDDGGYFWVSYYDSVLGRTDQSMAFSRVDAVGRYTHIYGYDKLGWTSSIGLSGTSDPGVAKFASRFTAKASEKVTAASFYAIAAGATYKVYAGPSLGSLTLRGRGTLAEAGYCTVPVSPRMYIAKGRKFVVAVRLDVPDTKYPIPLEMPSDDYASSATASHGQSYVRVGSAWQDLTTAGADFAEANVCLKAFTRK